jgi:hypothetical protein
MDAGEAPAGAGPPGTKRAERTADIPARALTGGNAAGRLECGAGEDPRRPGVRETGRAESPGRPRRYTGPGNLTAYGPQPRSL